MLKYDKSKVVFLDTETTGLYPWMGHEVWEIGHIDWNSRSGVWEETVWHVTPDLTRADPFSLSICRFYERTPGLYAPDRNSFWDNPIRVAAKLVRTLNGKHVIGAIPWFDIQMLHQFFTRNGQAPPTCHYHLIDVEAMALGYIAAMPNTSNNTDELPLPWKSEWLFERLGIVKQVDEEAHTAIGDTRKVKEVWERMVGHNQL